MSSQSNIAHTSFIEGCINKKRTMQDIYEALGLYSETADPRKEPVFAKDEANDLHKKIKEVAESFKVSYHNDREELLAELVKDGAFADDVQKLVLLYGQSLWGRKESQPTRYGVQQGAVTDDLNWEKKADRELICFYIRCWITRHAVQVLIPRKGKARTSTVVRAPSDGEQSAVKHSRTISSPNGTIPSDLPFRTPEVPDKGPPAGTAEAKFTTAHAKHNASTGSGVVSDAEVPSSTTPSKRKALNFQGQSASGKLQKVVKEARASTSSPQGRQRDTCSGIRSPALVFPSIFKEHEHRNQREDTCETDCTYAPPREGSVGTEAAIDPDEVMVDTQDLLSDVQFISNGDTCPPVRSPTIGPSGTYRSPKRQDAVILHDIQHGVECCEPNQASHPSYGTLNAGSSVWRSAPMTTTQQMDVLGLDSLQSKSLRMELFKLLLSHLNGINQFDAEAYKPEAEDKMNNILSQLWTNDAETLRSRVGNKFEELHAALNQWMEMRNLLNEFQRVTGYFGRPGDEWKAHLKRMDRISHAKASIAFVDLKSSINNGSLVLSFEPSFDATLAIAFDLLTQVDGCNGVEEFEALQTYNEKLMEWFS